MKDDILTAYEILGDIQNSMLFREDLRLTVRVERNNEKKWEVAVLMQKPKNHFKMFYALSIDENLLIAVEKLPDQVVHDEVKFKPKMIQALLEAYKALDIRPRIGSLAAS